MIRPTDAMTLLIVLAILLAAALVAGLLEHYGRLASPELTLSGDVKLEARFIGQYGQFGCVVVISALLVMLDGLYRWPAALAIIFGALLAMVLTHSVKRAVGRIRPRRERDGHPPGAFLGPTWRRHAWRESFPSSHAASAFSMSVVLLATYPDGAIVWWTLAGLTAFLRWLLDAHWLSDVLVGSAAGIVCGVAGLWLAGLLVAFGAS